jgi:hypothetical protein
MPEAELMTQFYDYEHLPSPAKRATAAQFANLAQRLLADLPPGKPRVSALGELFMARAAAMNAHNP